MRRCHVCQAENEDEAPRCTACNARLRRRERVTHETTDSPFSERADPINHTAVRAYYLALWGMVPFLGLVLGPLAAWLGLRGLRRGRGNAAFTAEGPGRAAVVLGVAVTVTHWLGAALIWAG
jgi:hypothetical protein